MEDSSPLGGEHDTPRERARLASIVSLLPKGRVSALDVGARDGFVTRELPSHFQYVTALDLEPPQINIPNVTSVRGDVTRLQFPDNSFDVVCCFEVLEHIVPSKLESACSELARVTKYELMLGVPFRQDLRLGRTRCLQCGEINPPWGHRNRFDARRLMQLFPTLQLKSTVLVGRTKSRTNPLAVILDDIAGNPNGSFVPGTRCIRCDNILTPYTPKSVVGKISSKLAALSNRLQNATSPPSPIWIHVVFSKTVRDTTQCSHNIRFPRCD